MQDRIDINHQQWDLHEIPVTGLLRALGGLGLPGFRVSRLLGLKGFRALRFRALGPWGLGARAFWPQGLGLRISILGVHVVNLGLERRAGPSPEISTRQKASKAQTPNPKTLNPKGFMV